VGVLYGLVAILVITPCFGFLMLMIPLQPREFATGLALFCVVPTTLGVGVALTAASKGNQALALLLTVSVHLLAIVSGSTAGAAWRWVAQQAAVLWGFAAAAWRWVDADHLAHGHQWH
jgi:hypothetical protein